jgi:hypothetical protein
MEKHGKGKRTSAVFYGNTILQPRYFWSMLAPAGFLQKYLCMPSKITQAAPSIVQIAMD